MITYTILRNGKVISTRTAFSTRELRETLDALNTADPVSFYRIEVIEPADA